MCNGVTTVCIFGCAIGLLARLAMKNDLKLLKSLNVLYAEDDNAVRAEYGRVLADLFAHVYEAKNGMEALELYEANDVHILITDNRMPLMGGIELIETIRKEGDDIPAFIMTSFSEKEELLKATRLKLVDFILKPVEYSAFKATLRGCLAELQKQKVFDYPLSDSVSYSLPTKTLKVNGHTSTLPLKEALLLELLLKNRGKIVSKERIADAVYDGEEMSEGGLKNLVLKLRQKIGHDYIQTLRGSGYLLT